MPSALGFVDNFSQYTPVPAPKFLSERGARARQRLYSAIPERTVTTPHGVRLRVDYSNFVERTLSDGRFESAFIAYLVDEMGDWQRFADIGANIGFFSLLAAKHNPECHVDAFEPLPRNVDRILANQRLNPTSALTIHAFALSNEAKAVPLHVSDENPAEASVSESLRSSTATRTMDAAALPLDDALDETPDAMKIDIEGAEIDALRGATRHLKKTPDLFVELHPSNIAAMGRDMEELVDLLADAGYSSATHVERSEQLKIDNLSKFNEEHSHVHIA